MDSPPIHIECCRSLDAPGLESAWNDLHRHTVGASLFASYDWCRCWLETVGRDAAACILLFCDAGRQIIGLAPLCISSESGARWLRFMGREQVSGDHLDLIAAPGDHARCVHALLTYVKQHASEFDGLLLGELHPDSLTRTCVIDWATESRLAWYERERRRVPYIDLPESFDALLARLSANQRYHVRRRRRGLLKQPSARVELIQDEARVIATLEAFFDLHRRRWELDGLPGNFHAAPMQEFLRRFCTASAGLGTLRLFVLSGRQPDAASQPQAVLICFHHGSTASYFQMGWAPQCPIDSPGVILLSHSIEQAIAEGLVRYDFLRGEEAYKFRWTQTWAEQTTLVVACGMSARVAIAADRMKNRVRDAMVHCLGPHAWEWTRRMAGKPAIEGILAS